MKPLLNAIVLGMMMAVTCGGMQIFVTDHAGGGTITLDVEPTDSIENIKSKIQDKRDYLPALQLLYFSGTFLESNRTLGDYDIIKDDLLDLYLVQVLPASGPLTGGNVVVITNMVPAIGDGSDITGVVVGVHTNVPTGQGTNWVAFVAPAGNVNGAVDILIQSTSAGERRLPQSYTYNPAGAIGGSTTVMRWSAVGGSPVPGQVDAKGANNTVYGMDYHENNLYIGGAFTNVGGSNCYRVARHDGTNWHSMQAGVTRVANVNGIKGGPGGIYTGGYYTNIGGSYNPDGTINNDGGTNAMAVARFDGTGWNAMGHPPALGNPERAGLGFSQSVNGYVNFVVPYTGTTVIAGGYFTNSDFRATGLHYIAKYDGRGWTNLQQGFRNVPLAAVYDRERDQLYVGGQFTNHYPTNTSRHLNYITRWNGTAWTNLARGLGNRVTALAVHPVSGELYIGGWFTNYTDDAGNKFHANYIAKWDPASQSFTNVGSGFNNWVYALAFDASGRLYAAGAFTNTWSSTEPNDRSAPHLPVARIAMWNGSHWTNVGRGVSDTIVSLAVNTNNNDVYAGGFFKLAHNNDGSSTDAWYVAKYGGQSTPSSGVEPSSGSVAGGYEVVISGIHLGDGSDITNVTICGASVAGIVRQSATQVVVVAGAGDPGQGDVRVFSTTYGESVAVSSFTYTGPAFALLGTNGSAIASGAAADAAVGTQFGALPSGVAATNVFAITNAGNASLNLSWITNGSTAFSVVSGPSAVAAGAVEDFVVAYESDGQAATASVEIVHDAINSPFMLHLASEAMILPQAIDFPAIAPQQVSGHLGLAATGGGSGNPVTFAVAAGPGMLADGTNLSFSGVGEVKVVASQAGDAMYEAAPDVTNTIHVYALSANAGPYAGGNTVTITNGNFGTITNVLVGGVTATIQNSGVNWVAITVPAIGSAGVKTVVIQTSDNGDTALAGAYTVNPAGVIGINNEDWNQWVEVTGMPQTRAHGGACVLGGQVFLAGGVRGYSSYATNSASFDGAIWSLEPHLPSNTMHMGAAVYDGSLFVVGGHAGLSPTRSVYRYDGSAWSAVEPLPQVTSMGGAGSLGGYLYAIGGHDGNQANTRTNVYRYDGSAWTSVAGLPEPRFYMGVAAFQGAIHVLGGRDASGTARTNVFRFDGTTWSEVAGLPEAKSRFAVATLRGRLYVVAGQVGFNGSTTAHCFDGTNWVAAADYPQGLFGLMAAEYDNYLYAFGGTSDDFFDFKTNVYRYPAGNLEPGVSPSSGSVAGGYQVVISGTNLGSGSDITGVTLCGVAATILSQSVDRVWVTAGEAAAAGTGDVVVHSTSYGATTGSGAFAYLREQQAVLVFNPASPRAYLTTNALAVTGGSGTGAVRFEVLSGPGTLVEDTKLVVTAGSGTIEVRATKDQDDRYFAVSATGVVEAAKEVAVVTLLDLAQGYNGTARTVTATSDPAGLVVTFTYDGDTNAPVAAGSYAVTGTVVDANWQGEASGMLRIARAGQAITFPAIGDQIATSLVELAATASSGLPVSFAVGSGPATITGGTNLTFIGAGDVSIIASQAGDTNYEAAPEVTNMFIVTKAVATVTITNLTQAYDGTQRTVNAAAMPEGLAVDLTYDGSSIAPTDAGRYTVTGTVSDAMYEGEAVETLVVTKAEALVFLLDLSATYDGMSKQLSATSDPAGLVVTFTYDGDTNAPVAAGSYAVTGTVVDANWQGEASGTLRIARAGQAITFPAIGDQIATSLVELAATASSGLPVSFAVGNGPAIITGGTNLTFTGPGDISIIASQSGDVNYAAAPDVTNTFTVLGLYTVTIVSAHGATDPTVGDQVYLQGSVITNTVTTPDTRGTTQYVAAGWVLAGHEPAIGGDTQVIITVTNDATLTWQWTTNYWLDTEAGPNGAVDVADGWQAAGATVPIEAIPDTYFAFAAWSGDASGSENPLGLLMAGPRSITVSFVALWTTNQPTPHWWLGEYGLTNNVENVVEDDTDGDGYTNADEFIMDTDPTNPASHLAVMELGPAYSSECLELIWTNDAPPYEAVTSVICDVTGIILGWPVSTNRRYDIQSSAAVWPADWQALPGMTGVVPASGWLTITNDLDGEQRVLRLRVGLPE